MTEPDAEPTKGDEPKHRSHRPSQAPLTHRMDLHTIRESFWQAGLEQPELEPQRPPRADRQITRPKPSAATQVPEEKRPMLEDIRTASEKPAVGGTPQQQLHNAKVQAVVSEGQKCLMYGGTTVVAGSILMLAWKGITRWLG